MLWCECSPEWDTLLLKASLEHTHLEPNVEMRITLTHQAGLRNLFNSLERVWQCLVRKRSALQYMIQVRERDNME